jgi:hypothetical protein
VSFHRCNASRRLPDRDADPGPAPAASTSSAGRGIFRAVICDYLSAYEPDAKGGRSVRAGDGGPSVPIIVEPLKRPTEVPAAPPAPKEPVREPEKMPA